MTANSPVAQLLHGVRVVDFTQALSGPYCTLMLADLGADVIKVEAPGKGDDSRHWGPPFIEDGGDATYFMSVNRNKRSVTLDLKDPEGLRLARRLIATADVVVENWRPGTAKRLGIDAATVQAERPEIVYCSISGFGQENPTRVGYDQIVQGTSGAMSMTGPDGEPTKSAIPIADITAGMFASNAILAALFERTRTGRGRYLDIAMHDSLVSMLSYQAARYLFTGVVGPKDGNHHSAIAPYGLFATSDGHVNICAGNDAQYERLCKGVGAPELVGRPEYATNGLRVENRATLAGELGAILERMTTAEVLDALEAAGVPAGPVRTLDEVFDAPEVAQRSLVVSVQREGSDRPVPVPNGPWKVDGHPAVVRRTPPRLGEHTAEIMAELGEPGPA